MTRTSLRTPPPLSPHPPNLFLSLSLSLSHVRACVRSHVEGKMLFTHLRTRAIHKHTCRETLVASSIGQQETFHRYALGERGGEREKGRKGRKWRERERERERERVCVCVCARARARVHACDNESDADERGGKKTERDGDRETTSRDKV